VATDNDRIYFQADSRFDVSKPLTFAVETVDSLATTWHIEYASRASGLVVTTDSYTSSADDAVRTVYLDAPSGYASRGLGNGYDFAIVVEDGEPDVVVRWVRVIRGSK
jgi:hypothetical protein